jgi:hypothetical protein
MSEEPKYNEEIEIDPDALDVECLRQASLFMKYSQREAREKRNVALATENVKIIRSELIKLAAGNKDLGNAQKVEAFYREHPKHKEAKQELIEAEYQLNIATSAVFAFNHRKTMLEKLVQLAMADYFARPSEPRDVRKELDKRRENTEIHVRNRAAEKLSRRRV